MSKILSGDDWLHIGGLIAIGIGLADHALLFNGHSWGDNTDLLFVVGGIAGLGLRIFNGAAAAIRNGQGPHA